MSDSTRYEQLLLLHKRKTDFQQMKKAIWLYFFLLIFEGSLRKWVLPVASDLLLIVRDPVALFILFKAVQQKLFQNNSYLIATIGISVISFFTSFFWGHGNVFVAIYGLRIMLLHFPLIFVIGKVFTHTDVIKLGKIMLWLALPMVVLIGLQFYSPQSAWVNRGVGGNMEGAGFGGANDFFRPPGTFSFTNGNSLFWGLVAAYIIYFWLNTNIINKLLLIGSTAALFGAMSFSISRTLFFQLGLSIAFALSATSRKPRTFWRLIIAIAGVVLIIIILSKFSVFQIGLDTLMTRFDEASVTEGGLKGTLGDRFLGGMISAITDSVNIPFWGHGLGMGTNAGAKIMTGSSTTFLISEGEWGRVIGETGVLLGLSTILIRGFLSFNLLRRGYEKMVLGNSLSWILLSYSFLNVLQGPWGQPTPIGFGILSGGLVLAALKSGRRRPQTTPNP